MNYFSDKTDFVEIMEFRNYSQNTIDSYVWHLDKFFTYSKEYSSRVTNNLVDKYMLSIKDRHYVYKNQAINAIKLFFDVILKRKCTSILIERPKKEKKLPKCIDHELLTNKIAQTINTKARLILSLGYGCGLRSNEVIELKLEDIDIEKKELLIHGKGAKERIVPISDNLVSLLISYFDEYQPIIYLFNGKANNGCFKFQYSASSILSLVKTNIGNYTFHQLRHSFATRLLNLGYDIRIIQRLLGHSSSKITEIYTHVTTNLLQNIELPV